MSALKKIICIDDEDDILEVAKLSLETVGNFNVTTCNGGKAGIAEAKSNKPDLILLDVMMPEMDGPETLKRIKEDEQLKNTPVVFMTAKVQPSEVKHYLTLGATGVISKPFDPMTLPEEVNKYWMQFNDAK